jgi:hypothetical protein
MRLSTISFSALSLLLLAGCDDRYLVGFGPDAAPPKSGPGGSGGAGGTPVAGGSGGSGGSTGGSGGAGIGGSGGTGGAPVAGSGGSPGGAGGSAYGGAGGTAIGGSGGTGIGGGGGTAIGGSGGGGGSSAGPATVACPAIPAPLSSQPLGISTDHAAERLARLLWGTRPDPDLLIKAQLMRDNLGVMGLARDMLKDPRASGQVLKLMRSWLALDQLNPIGISAELRASLLKETDEFVTRVVLFEDGTLNTLLTAPFTYVDAAAAAHYGVAPLPRLGATRVALDSQQRSGILTQGSVLTSFHRATRRGIWIRKAFLCQEIPPAPDSIVLPPPDSLPPPATYRQRLEKAVNMPQCHACHVMTDPPGFALEKFDELGRWRETDDGLPVDDSGEFEAQTGDPTHFKFAGAPALGKGMAFNCEVHRCAVQSFLKHALGSELRPSDQASLDALGGAFAASGYNLKELLIAVTGSRSFLAP